MHAIKHSESENLTNMASPDGVCLPGSSLSIRKNSCVVALDERQHERLYACIINFILSGIFAKNKIKSKNSISPDDNLLGIWNIPHTDLMIM